MIAVLRLRAIGDEVPRVAREHARGGTVRVFDRATRTTVHWVPDRPWVARRGADGRREFLSPRRDGRSDPETVWLHYELADGEYEVHELLGWNRARRYRVRVAAGAITEVDGGTR